MNRRIALPLLAILTLAAACGEGEGDAAALDPIEWDGAEPSRPGKEDDIAASFLSIFSRHDQTSMTVIAPDRRAMPGSEDGGSFHLDGYAIDDQVVLVIDGSFYRYDGEVEQHTLMVRPYYTSSAEGAPGREGFLTVDLTSPDRARVVRQEGDALGTRAGAFRGRIYATRRVRLGGDLPDNLEDLAERSPQRGERPPNTLDFSSTPLFIRPTIAITRVLPQGTNCLGAERIDATTSGVSLEVETAVYGFAPDDDVQIDLEYHVPEQSKRGFWGHTWGVLTWPHSSGPRIETFSQKRWMDSDAHNRATQVSFDGVGRSYRTDADAWGDGDDLYTLNIHARAHVLNGPKPRAATPVARHTMVVTNEGELVVADYFEMCRPEDERCRVERRRSLPSNLVARREAEEFNAIAAGRFETTQVALTECRGGGAFAGPYSETCSVYQAESDRELKASIEAELQGSVELQGRVAGQVSAAGVIPGLGEADVSGKLKAAFNLDASFNTSFKESVVWKDNQDLNVLYDSSLTQIQWWRIVHPRVRYMRIVEYDLCGAEVRAQEAFAEDYSDTSMVLTCRSGEANPIENACNPIYPDREGIEACETALIDPDGALGRQCLDEPAIIPNGPIVVPTEPGLRGQPDRILPPQLRRVGAVEECESDLTLRNNGWVNAQDMAQDFEFAWSHFQVGVYAGEREQYMLCHEPLRSEDAIIDLRLYKLASSSGGPSQLTLLQAGPGEDLVERLRQTREGFFELGVLRSNMSDESESRSDPADAEETPTRRASPSRRPTPVRSGGD